MGYSYFAHVIVIRYGNTVQPIVAVVLVLFFIWIVCGFLCDKAKQKGRDKGFQEGYDFGFKAALRKAGLTEKELNGGNYEER